jgi:hypothetical protein
MRIGRVPWRPPVKALVQNPVPAFPPISLVLPAKDEGTGWRRAQESLRALRYPEERIEVLELAPGMNRAQARNAVLGKARHACIAFVSERGPFAPDWLAAARRRFEENANVACVVTPLVCPPGGGAASGAALPFAAGCHALYRKEAFASLGEFDPDLEQDMDLDMMYRLSDKGLWKWDILNFRQGPDSIMKAAERVPWRHQAHDLGERHARLYRKHPQRLPRLYFWLPGSFLELILQAVRRFFTPQSLAELGFNSKLSLREKASLLLFLTACSHAYRKALISIPLEKAARRTCFLFLGRSHTEPGQDLFEYLWGLAQGGDTAIHVANSVSPLISWKEFLTRLFVSPGFWTWKREFVSMSAWRLRPPPLYRQSAGLPSARNVRRIRERLDEWGVSCAVILGDIGPRELAAWGLGLRKACPHVEWHTGMVTLPASERSLENATV